MKYLIILLIFFTSCKKEYQCVTDKSARYFYYETATSKTCCSQYINACDSKTIQQFKNNCPSGWVVKYAP